jgi:catechol 2,3-dioxygenase-like lactoylglutathione lyase family enzyme
MTPGGILETCLYAHDLDAAERFYSEVMGLTVFAKQPGRHVFFRCGRGMFLVFNPISTLTEIVEVDGRSMSRHGATGPSHMAFAVGASEIDPWRKRLHEADVAIESEVAWPGGGHSIYFRDPAGNLLELATPSVWNLDERDVLPAVV